MGQVVSSGTLANSQRPLRRAVIVPTLLEASDDDTCCAGNDSSDGTAVLSMEFSRATLPTLGVVDALLHQERPARVGAR